MGVIDSSRMCPERSLFRGFVVDFGVLVMGCSKDDEAGFSRLLESWEWLRGWGLGPVVRWYRAVGHEFDLEPVVSSYVHRCMGHRLDRRLVLRHACVAALCAGVFEGGRWLECEGVVSGDHAASYLYARVLGGRLPPAMHNRLVLEGHLGGSCVLRRYISEFG